ncbi:MULTISPECIES: outer membrane protein [Cetobacterium]|jgi:opacity protein-like surface antigen|uniref:Outer membrane beta-barrel protein n=1 Tax=Candidatus Cetobacterium colombiensis TaxID=3073100 RepID=A0ABU4WDA4_9FUSO|nr:outer membrane beta-barrel protein [Candidatus Cetobacterium colombiensis]MDX8336684.1 outer membrane beta-barrel protein [Candidatus Cetobacterium colombiensis]
MKKLTLLACSLFAFAAVAQAKEVVAPVTSSKEVVNEPVVIEEVVVAPVVENPWGFINLRAGWDFWGEYGNYTHRHSNRDYDLPKKTKDFGGELAVEAYKSWDHLDLGLGVAYQHHMKRKSADGVSGAEYQSVPLYVTGRYDINYWDWSATPYLKANVGYSFNFDSKSLNTPAGDFGTKVDDGLYWAAGVGVQYEDFNVDVLYGANYAKTKVDGGDKFDNDYERVTLSVGYRFNIW